MYDVRWGSEEMVRWRMRREEKMRDEPWMRCLFIGLNRNKTETVLQSLPLMPMGRAWGGGKGKVKTPG